MTAITDCDLSDCGKQIWIIRHFALGTLLYAAVPSTARSAALRCSSLAFAASALVLDSTFDAKGIKADPNAADNDGQIRLLVYMVRCAYAHRISARLWEVRGDYKRKITVNLGSHCISIDLRDLHGRPFEFDHLETTIETGFE